MENITPGTHQLNVSAQGYDGIAMPNRGHHQAAARSRFAFAKSAWIRQSMSYTATASDPAAGVSSRRCGHPV